MKKTSNHIFSLWFILLITLVWTIKNYSLLNNKTFTVTFFNIHLWDSSLIKTPNNKTILIDGGAWDDLISKLSHQLGFFERKIDLLILTHPESDHIGWFVELIKRFKIWKIWLTDNNFRSNEYDNFLKTILNKNIPYEFVNEKHDLIFDKDLFIDILYPFSSWEWILLQEKNVNDGSIVLKLTIWKEKKSILYTWDISKKLELLLLKNIPNLKSDILKVAHHWSSSSSLDQFISEVNPKKAIIMASKDNKFKHPHSQILERYSNHKIETFVTWISWNIILNFK